VDHQEQDGLAVDLAAAGSAQSMYSHHHRGRVVGWLSFSSMLYVAAISFGPPSSLLYVGGSSPETYVRKL
jgi:hypothetical protein